MWTIIFFPSRTFLNLRSVNHLSALNEISRLGYPAMNTRFLIFLVDYPAVADEFAVVVFHTGWGGWVPPVFYRLTMFYALILIKFYI